MSSALDYVKRQWLVLGGAFLALVVVVWSARDQDPPLQSAIDFTFTLVRADAKGLGCSSSETLGGERCGFDADGSPVEVDRPLRPFTTTATEVVLLKGVFEDPNLVKWVEDAEKDNDDSRVTVSCSGTFLGRAQSVGVRWGTDGSFDPTEDLRIGAVKECNVKHPPAQP